ncbi:hypothetical protein EVAR_65761_1 [Eumeta japonica]|uniref:Uncharacterized protein n=1 Tax=Eumeta variegata TaxID=151549 RepID=A0A4C1ZR68_EUMVA|nr:hypothetical protein EVAR_65761_1 [Eumeta japonica]
MQHKHGARARLLARPQFPLGGPTDFTSSSVHLVRGSPTLRRPVRGHHSRPLFLNGCRFYEGRGLLIVALAS